MQVRGASRPALDAGEDADRDRLLYAVHVLASPIAVSIARFTDTGEGACQANWREMGLELLARPESIGGEALINESDFLVSLV
jgi:hypothetical protein